VSDDNTTTATICAGATAAATVREVHAATERLDLTLDAIARRPQGRAIRDADACVREEQHEALADIYGWALDGWFEAPESTLVDTWLQRLVDDPRRPIATARAAAVVIAARVVHDAAVAAAADRSDEANHDAMRRMARGSLHVLGPDVLRGVLATSPSGQHVRYLNETASVALQAGSLERAIAAGVLPMAGAILPRSITDTTGRVGMRHRDPEAVIRAQHCCIHDVFCCPRCPDEPTVATGHKPSAARGPRRAGVSPSPWPPAAPPPRA